MEDRVPANAGRVLITPEDGSAPFYAVLTRADNPTVAGTPLNKANLLSDTTANLYGVTSKTATPDQLFQILAPAVTDRIKKEVVFSANINGSGSSGADYALTTFTLERDDVQDYAFLVFEFDGTFESTGTSTSAEANLMLLMGTSFLPDRQFAILSTLVGETSITGKRMVTITNDGSSGTSSTQSVKFILTSVTDNGLSNILISPSGSSFSLFLANDSAASSSANGTFKIYGVKIGD